MWLGGPQASDLGLESWRIGDSEVFPKSASGCGDQTPDAWGGVAAVVSEGVHLACSFTTSQCTFLGKLLPLPAPHRLLYIHVGQLTELSQCHAVLRTGPAPYCTPSQY